MSLRELRTYDRALEEAVPARIEAFRKCFARFGGRPDAVDHDTQWFRLRYWDYIKRYRQLKAYQTYLDNFHFDFIADPTLNAVASVKDGTYLIGINLGAIRNLQAFFMMAMSHPEVLPDVGDPAKEVSWLASLANCRWVDPLESVVATANTHVHPPSDFPIDPVRRLYAHRLAILAMDFLFFHELGHLINGHLEFLLSTHGLTAIDELGAVDRSHMVSLDYQALELNADSHGVGWMVGEFLNLPERLPSSSAFATRTEAIESLILAMITVFLIFDQQKTRLADYVTAQHPHPAVRMTNVAMMSMTAAERESASALRMVQAAWKTGLNRAESAFRALDMGSAVWHVVGTENKAVHKEYMRVATRFQEIDRLLRPDLKRF